MIARFARWYDEHPVAGDACLAGTLLLIAVLSEAAAPEGTGRGLLLSGALVACVPFRRRAPVAVFAAVCIVCLAQLAVLDRIIAGDFVALVALYTIVAYGPETRLGAVATGCMLAGALLAAVRWDRADAEVTLLPLALSTGAAVLLAATLGAWRRSRHAELAALRERNRLLAVERDQQAAVGAAIERARIARELHDVVAHSLSVIIVQADGAAALAEQRPATAAAALGTIGDTGREALGQMRRLLGVLRTERDGDAHGADGVAFAPQPGVAQLDALVEQVRRAGLPASLVVEGSPQPLTGALDVTIYRLAQEALTNVLKHAGNVSRVRVALTYRDDDAIELVVRDDGQGLPAGADGAVGPHETGHGLVGMRERVDLHDGTLAAGPLDEGGWAVRAVLPVERVAATA